MSYFAAILHESSGFLAYGPVGLAALMIAMTIVAICLPRFGAQASGLLKWVLVCGSLCFLIAVIPQYAAMYNPQAYGGAAREAVLRSMVKVLDKDISALQGVGSWVNSSMCSGGGHGLPADSRAAPSATIDTTLSDLSRVKAQAESTVSGTDDEKFASK